MITGFVARIGAPALTRVASVRPLRTPLLVAVNLINPLSNRMASTFGPAVNVGSLTMSNGQKLPRFGLGTFLASNPEELKTALRTALDAGYRYIDTAALYKNEYVIGEVLQEYYDAGKLKRSDIFLATKLPFYGHEHVDHFVKESLSQLRTDYLDLYIIHMSFPCKADERFEAAKDETGKYIPVTNVPFIQTWRELEQFYKKGVFKALGLSNFNQTQIQKIYDEAEIKPHNLQVEIHALWPQHELVNYCNKMHITVSAYAPLGSPGSAIWRGASGPVDDCLTQPLVRQLSEKYRKTPAQILLRQIIQRGLSTIPKSTNPKRIIENIDIFDFELTDEEMKRFDTEITGHHRLFNFEFAAHHPWYAINQK